AVGAFSLTEASVSFVVVLVGGIAMGFLVGFLVDVLARKITDTALAVAITLIAPYAAYLPAESIGVSGVLAAVVGGLWARHAMRPPWQGVVVVSWSGLRGVVSLAAALALPVGFPARDLILLFTFVVILTTLVGQGLTLPLLIRALGLAPDGDTSHAEAHARALTAEAALRRIDELAT